MAIINKMRKSGWVFIVILGALALFVLSDLISGFQKGGGLEDPIVGEINGVEVTYSEYSTTLNNRIQMREQNKEGQPLDDNDRSGAANDAWDDLFRKYVVTKEYEKLGVVASVDELSKLLFSEDAHPFVKQYFTDEKGQFSSGNVKNWYNQVYKTNPEAQIFFNSLKDAIVSSVQSEKYRDLIEKGIHVTNFDALQDYMQQSKSVTGSIVGLQLTSVADDEISFTEDELKAYYKNNQNKFKLKEGRDLEFVSWNVFPSTYDSTEAQNALMMDLPAFTTTEDDSAFAAFASDRPVTSGYRRVGEMEQGLNNFVSNATVGQIIGPILSNGAYVLAKVSDIRQGDEIRYKYKNIMIPRDWNNKADSIVKINSAKVFFERMKSEPITDIINSARELGYMVMGDAEGSMPWGNSDMIEPQIQEEVKKGKKGDYIFKITDQGINLIFIEDNPNMNEYLVYEIQKEISPSMKTINEAYAEASIFRSKLANGKDGKFDIALEEAGYAKRIAKDLEKSGSSIPGINDSKEILRWAFDDERALNEVSDVISADGRQFVFHISGLRKEGIGTFEQVREMVVAEVINEKKFELLEQKLTKAKEGKPNMVQIAIELGTVAQDFSRTTFKTDGFQAARDEAKIQGVALGLKNNIISKVVRGEKGCYIVMVTDESNPEIPDNLESRKPMVNANLMQTLEIKVVASLKAMGNIQDFRAKFF